MWVTLSDYSSLEFYVKEEISIVQWHSCIKMSVVTLFWKSKCSELKQEKYSLYINTVTY